MAGNSSLFLGPRGKHVAAPREVVGHISHNDGAHTRGHAGTGIARDGAAKHVHPVMVHGGMTRQQNGKTVTLSSYPDASDPNVLDPQGTKTKSKHYPAPAVAWGMKARGPHAHSPSLGEAILNEATADCSDFARGHVGHVKP